MEPHTTLPFPKQPVTSGVDGCQGAWGPPAPEGLWNSIPRQVSILALWMLPFKARTAKAAEPLMTNCSQWEKNAWQISGLFHNPPPPTFFQNPGLVGTESCYHGVPLIMLRLC